MKKTALILGIGGQDGSYLAEELLAQGYEVHGLCRRSSVDNLKRLESCRSHINLHFGDLLDPLSVESVIRTTEPEEIYNEADQDDVRWSYASPLYSYGVTFGAVGALLEIVVKHAPNAKVFQPISSTIFGKPTSYPQDENTPLNPLSPYACAKAGALHLARYYRQEYGLFVSTGIMYNHDSGRRGEGYLVNKICRQALEIAEGGREYLELYNLEEVVDIGHAMEFMISAQKIMQLARPDDFIIATGKFISIGYLAKEALSSLGLSTTCIKENSSIEAIESIGTMVGDISKLQKATGSEFKLYGETLIKTILQEIIENENRNCRVQD